MSRFTVAQTGGIMVIAFLLLSPLTRADNILILHGKNKPATYCQGDNCGITVNETIKTGQYAGLKSYAVSVLTVLVGMTIITVILAALCIRLAINEAARRW